MDGSAHSTGARSYERLNNVEKATLADHLRSQVNGDDRWTALLTETISSVVARRAVNNESLDGSDIIEEVLCLMRPQLDPSVREGLFRKIATML